MEDAQPQGFTLAQAVLIALSLLSLVFSTLSLLSEFVFLGRLPGLMQLSLAVTKVVVYDGLNAVRLMLRAMELRKPELRKPLSLRSTKTREYCVQIVDDTLGAIPAALAVAALNSPREGEEGVFLWSSAAVTALAAVAGAARLLRVAHETGCLAQRGRQRSLALAAGLVNSLGAAASLLGLAQLLVLALQVQGVLGPAPGALWFLPVMHTPILSKRKDSFAGDRTTVPHYLYGR